MSRDSARYEFHRDLYIDNVRAMKRAFASRYPNFAIGYSFKTNYHPAVVAAALEEGLLAEVVSPFEYLYAVDSGFGSSVIFNGPIPSEEKVWCAIHGGMANIDNPDEYEYVAKTAERLGTYINVGLRATFDIGNGVDSRFGMHEDELLRVACACRDNPFVNVIGLHCHIGMSRQLRYWRTKAEKMAEIAKRIGGIGYIDLGGGMYGPMPSDLIQQFDGYVSSYDDYAVEVCDVMNTEFPEQDVKLIVEPGTALVGNTFDVVSSVISIKDGFVTIDCSSHDTGPLVDYKDVPLIIEKHGTDRKHVENAMVCANTCLEYDIIKKSFTGDIAVGDVVRIPNCGAYSWSLADDFITEKLPVIAV